MYWKWLAADQRGFFISTNIVVLFCFGFCFMHVGASMKYDCKYFFFFFFVSMTLPLNRSFHPAKYTQQIIGGNLV